MKSKLVKRQGRKAGSLKRIRQDGSAASVMSAAFLIGEQRAADESERIKNNVISELLKKSGTQIGKSKKIKLEVSR